MNIYTAAVYSNNYKPGQARYEKLNEVERESVENLPHILESYHYVGKQRYVDEMRADNAQVFLDSGAFSAFTLKVKLSVEAYCNYIRDNIDIIRKEDGVVMASVLDGIGNPLFTYRNQLEMEARGCTPLPCFHYAEDEKYLEHYVKNYEYITLGGLVPVTTGQAIVWLDRIWRKYLTDGSGNAKLKVHGFGITTTSIMERYPWYSVDSSSWIQAAAFGSIMTPKHGPIKISAKSPSRHDANQHITTLSQLEQNHLIDYIARAGYDAERLATIYESRAAYNLQAFVVINALLNASHTNKFSHTVQDLFDGSLV